MPLRRSFLLPGHGLSLLSSSSSPSSPARWAPTKLRVSCSLCSLRSTFPARPYTSVMIVPTGVGAAIGGYAGDALPVARALASVVDCLISHPNVMNAAMLYWPMPNALYVEGYALDKFAEGSWALQPVHQNKVGLVLDAGMEEELQIRHLQVADAARASLGLPVMEYTRTDMPLMGVDSLAGVEAVISHLVVEEFQIPCAHAPALSSLPLTKSLCPKSAAEEIGYTFLPCVLAGLSRAPQYIIRKSGGTEIGCILSSDVDSVVLPIDTFGGKGALAFARGSRNKAFMIAVEENDTVLNDTPDKLGIDAIKVSNYWEAIGVVAAHKAGIDPKSLRKGIDNIKQSPLPGSFGLNVSPPSLHDEIYSY
uniref:Putative lipoprotein syc1174_c n=1 Tax=Anthurium amnicola TaxID=1678845 RepID=A0A1D1YSQ0_9ARAE